LSGEHIAAAAGRAQVDRRAGDRALGEDEAAALDLEASAVCGKRPTTEVELARRACWAARLLEHEETALHVGLEPAAAHVHLVAEEQPHASTQTKILVRRALRAGRQAHEDHVGGGGDRLRPLAAEPELRSRNAHIAERLDALGRPLHGELIGRGLDAPIGQVHDQHVLAPELDRSQRLARLERRRAAHCERAVPRSQRPFDPQPSRIGRHGVDPHVAHGDAERYHEGARVGEVG
jgi:hypothetical protein